MPAGTIAAMVRALPENNLPTPAFRDGAVAILRLSRARGRMECDALALLFEADISDDRRRVILDLLGTAGTPEAQIVMRRLLSLAVARQESRTFASFVQRLGFVERPDVPTLRFLTSVYAESRHEAHEVRAACAYTLGAATGRAHVWGLIEPAVRAAEVLRRDLLIATTPEEKCALVTALGNAGLDTDVILIVRFVDDPDVRVRSAAALGLRRMHTYESKSALLSILSGDDHVVAEAALSSLFGQSLEAEELVRLARLVVSGRTALDLDSRVLRLIVTQKLGGVTRGFGGSGASIVEEAVHLLLMRINDKRVYQPGEKVCDGQTTQIVNESGAYVRAEPVAPTPAPTTSGSARPRLIVPKTPLPYSAGYRMVSMDVDEPIAAPKRSESLKATMLDGWLASADKARERWAVNRTLPYDAGGDRGKGAGSEARLRSAFSVPNPVRPVVRIR